MSLLPCHLFQFHSRLLSPKEIVNRMLQVWLSAMIGRAASALHGSKKLRLRLLSARTTNSYMESSQLPVLSVFCEPFSSGSWIVVNLQCDSGITDKIFVSQTFINTFLRGQFIVFIAAATYQLAPFKDASLTANGGWNKRHQGSFTVMDIVAQRRYTNTRVRFTRYRGVAFWCSLEDRDRYCTL